MGTFLCQVGRGSQEHQRGWELRGTCLSRLGLGPGIAQEAKFGGSHPKPMESFTGRLSFSESPVSETCLGLSLEPGWSGPWSFDPAAVSLSSSSWGVQLGPCSPHFPRLVGSRGTGGVLWGLLPELPFRMPSVFLCLGCRSTSDQTA